ncbi:MAG: lipopolysaccharide assembly protein LapB [Limnohabitans sp.]|nr:lipopolysaccharide assembly protein LapB [Limnohabitans sp.]
MDLDLSWIFIGLPLVFVLGWLASRFDLRQLRFENRQNPKAYFKGLNHLLNEQQDQAIDAFIEAVQHDPDTSELHFALGNLFRRRGEYERAVRVHQHLLGRGDLSASDRQRAQHALALDYLKAGILDRAENALLELMDTPLTHQAELALLNIYERTRDWEKAARMTERLDKADQGSFSVRQAHYLCEQAQVVAKQNTAQALTQLNQAIALSPRSARAYVYKTQLLIELEQPDQAFETLLALRDHAPAYLSLTKNLLLHLAIYDHLKVSVHQLLQDCYNNLANLDILEALVDLESSIDPVAARDRYTQHLQKTSSLIAATRWLSGEKFAHEALHPPVQKALEEATKPLKRYRCAACGFEAQLHFWQCPGCQAWDSYPPRRIEEL